MKINKKFLTIGALVFVALALAYLSLQQQPKRTTQNTPSPLPTPVIESTDEVTFISSNLKKEDFKIPETLPTYTLDSNNIKAEDAQKLALFLGFDKDPVQVGDQRTGLAQYWSNENATLIIYPDIHKVVYTTARQALNKGLSADKEKIKGVALQFIKDMPLIPAVDTTKVSVAYLEYREDTNGIISIPQNADVANVYFDLAVDQYPILTSNLSTVTIAVTLQNNVYAVSSLQIEQVPILEKSTEYRLKTFEELNNSIKEAKVQYLEPADVSQIKNIVVKSVSIAYLKEERSNQQILQPIFYLKGQATMYDGTTKTVILYLPAITSSAFGNQ